MLLIEFAALFATSEESACYTRSVRQVVPPELRCGKVSRTRQTRHRSGCRGRGWREMLSRCAPALHGEPLLGLVRLLGGPASTELDSTLLILDAPPRYKKCNATQDSAMSTMQHKARRDEMRRDEGKTGL